MNRNRILFTIMIMSLSLIGLISLQLYLIQNAVKVKEANFLSEVKDAVKSVVLKLEKIELTRQINDPKYGASPILLIDSLNKQIAKNLEKSDYKNKDVDSNIDARGQITFEFIRKKSGQILQQYANNPADTPVLYNEIGTRSINSPIQIDSNNDQHRGSIVMQLMESLINPNQNKPIEKRIDKYLLDALLKNEFNSQNINTPYEFGVYTYGDSNYCIEKTGNYTKELSTKGLVFNLFPGDMFSSNPSLLTIYFPDAQQYLLSKMWFILLIAIVLIIVIMAVFMYSISTIIRQKRLSDMKNDFINNMTHEFKTPVSTIALACEALNDNDIKQSASIMQSYIGIINDENKRLGKMAEKILQTAILDTGQLNLKYENIDINRIIEDVYKSMVIVINNRNGILEKRLNAKNNIIFADKVHITNMIYNLIDNANKYTPNIPHIIISTQDYNEGILIKIKDNGIGISKSNQKKVFEKLYRVPTGNKHDVKGFGLGLSYVKVITELHEGNISVESELRKGSTFKIYLQTKK